MLLNIQSKNQVVLKDLRAKNWIGLKQNWLVSYSISAEDVVEEAHAYFIFSRLVLYLRQKSQREKAECFCFFDEQSVQVVLDVLWENVVIVSESREVLARHFNVVVLVKVFNLGCSAVNGGIQNTHHDFQLLALIASRPDVRWEPAKSFRIIPVIVRNIIR